MKRNNNNKWEFYIRRLQYYWYYLLQSVVLILKVIVLISDQKISDAVQQPMLNCLSIACISILQSLIGLRHIPHVGNVAIGRDITSSSTCGTKGPEQYCAQDPPAIKKQCSVCDNSDHQDSHSPSLMIDYGDSVHSLSRTWWQSESNISHVDIQLKLEEAFFFSHIIISFKSRRPAAMILHKSIDDGNSFQKLHYYASDCAREFGPVTDAPCTSEYSHPSPGEVC